MSTEKQIARLTARLNAVETADELDAARFTDMVPHVHIIIGGGGRCMCGIYSGKAFSCSEILGQKSQEFQSAIIAAQMIAENGGEPV